MTQLVFANLVAETATAAGTGAFALQGAVSAQYSSFSTKIQIGKTVVYTARQGALYEVGYGVLTSSTQLTRVGVYDSSSASGYVNSVTPGSPGFVSFDNTQTLTIYNDVPAQLFLAQNPDGSIASPTSIRKSIFVDTNTQMKALGTYADGETVFVTGFGDSSGIQPGLFRFNAGTSTAPDGVDTFRNDNSSTGLYQRQKLVIQGNFQGSATFDAATSGGGFTSKEYANPSSSNANDYFARIVDASAGAWRWASRLNQSGGVKNFLNLFSPGNAQDRIETTVPFVQASVTDSTGLKARSVAFLSGVSRLAFARVDAANATSAADYREIPLTKGGYIVTNVKDIYDLKQIDPTSAGSGFADYDMAVTRGINTASSDSGHTLTGSAPPVYWYWLSTSTATEDLVNVVRPSVGSAASGNGRWIREVSDITAGGTFTSGVATPSVKNGNWFITAGTTAITNFLNGYEGQWIVIQRGSTDIVITHNGTNIDLGGNNITLTATNPRLELIYQGGAWRSIGGAGSTIIPTTLNGVAGVSDTLQNRYSNRRFVEAQDYGLVLGSSAAASTNSSIINGLIAAIGSRGGGILVLPPGDIYIAATIDIKFPRVQLWGAGFESFHDSGTSTSTDPIFGTRLIATTATTMVKIRTPYASEQGVSASATWKYTGAGFKYIILQGGAIATAAMIIDSVSGIDVDVYATNFNASTFFTVTSGVSGTDLGEACDVQVSRMSFRARAIDTAADQAAHILTLSGSSNANCSLNRNPLYGIDVYAEHKNGNILNGQNCDNNDISIVGVRVSGGTGYTALFNGTTASQTQGGSSNRLVYVAGGGPIYNQGVGDTNSHGTVTAGIWNEAYYDDGNGTPLPTAGTGSKWTARQTSNGHFNEIISNNGVYGYFVTSITSNSRIYDGGPSKIAFALASAGSDTAYLDFQTIAGVPYLDGAAGFIGLAVSGTPVLRCDTNGFGYQTGQSLGGTVTQATSKSTGVTLNKPNGQITMNAATLNAYSAAQFTLTNSCIGASDVVILNHISGGSPGAYVFTSTPAVGSTLITVRNVLNVNLSEAIVIQYSIIKSTVN